MFEALREFDNIVVSGPQRSGTRITAKIIAHDTEKTYIDEKDIHNHDFRLLEWHLQKKNVVIQCPGLCHMLHSIQDKSTLIIVVRRPIEEIIASEHRCWHEESRKHELYKYGCSEGIISRIKYEFWEKVQKAILRDRAREVNYHELLEHPMFIENRSDFRWDQTQ